MNVPKLVESLIAHEGMKLVAYKDHLGNDTLGVGHLLSRPISERAAKVILDDDIADCIEDLDKSGHDWRAHSDARQNVLVEMAFNLGIARLNKFVKMWDALKARDYQSASDEMIASSWRVQVGKRAIALAQVMREGV